MLLFKEISKYILAAIFILGGINHFAAPEFYRRMMPPIFPAHLFLIYLTGFFEIALGALLLTGKFSAFAAWGIIALLIAVYPANIYMAMRPEIFPEFNPLIFYLRLPLQIVLIAWAYWHTKNL